MKVSSENYISSSREAKDFLLSNEVATWEKKHLLFLAILRTCHANGVKNNVLVQIRGQAF